jgi:hypothetical protein
MHGTTKANAKNGAVGLASHQAPSPNFLPLLLMAGVLSSHKDGFGYELFLIKKLRG